MDYEKKYKEALERARYYHSKDYMLINSAIENIFPELKESEGEKIRKEIIAFIKRRDRSGCDYDYDKWLAWLKSLKQRIGWEPSEEQVRALRDMLLTGDMSGGRLQILIELCNDLNKLKGE